MTSGISDTLRLAAALTPRKLMNAAAVTGSFLLSRLSRGTLHPALPFAAAVEPTTSCNLRCPECPSGLRSFSRPTGMLDEELFAKVLEDMRHHLIYLTLYFQGEPYLHPRFLELVRIAKKRRIYVATSTNGHYLDDDSARATVESGLDRLIVSIDGASPETYARYRIGGSLQKAVDGATRVVEWKRRLGKRHPMVEVQVVVMRSNEHELDELSALARRIGADRIVFKTAQVYGAEDPNGLIPLNDRYSRYVRQKDGTWKIKSSLENRCWKMWHSFVMTWDGKVVPCCFDKDATHVLGDLNKETVRAVWKSEKYRDFRSRLSEARSKIDICTNCSEGVRVFS